MLSRVHEFVQSLHVLPSRWTKNGFRCFTDGDTGKVKAPAGLGGLGPILVLSLSLLKRTNDPFSDLSFLV